MCLYKKISVLCTGYMLVSGPAQPLGELSHHFRPPPPPKKKKTLINQGPQIIKKESTQSSHGQGYIKLD